MSTAVRQVPDTWEELVELAERYNGTDLGNGPSYGFCMFETSRFLRQQLLLQHSLVPGLGLITFALNIDRCSHIGSSP